MFYVPNDKELKSIQLWVEEHFDEDCEVTSWWNKFDFKKKVSEPRTYVIRYIPGEIGPTFKVQCEKCNTSENVTDYSSW